MPSVVQEQPAYTSDLAHKERPAEPGFMSGITGFTPKLVEPSVVPPVSGFTAVNGGRASASPSEPPARANGIIVDPRQPPEAHHSPKADQLRAFGKPQQPNDWHYTNGDHARRTTPPNQNGKDATSASPHKRKRSSSGDYSGSSASPVEDSLHKRANGISSSAGQPSHGDFSPPSERRASLPFPRGTSESLNADSRIAEALQRETQDMNQAARIASEARSGDEHLAGSSHSHLEPYSGEAPRPPLLTVDPKKRKRQFANRTKTGCQTCRRRKKKCDEGKPECANCRRGGFLCEGYLAKTPYKPSVSRGPVQIQSKDGYGDSTPHPHQHIAQPHHQPQLYHRHGPPRDSSTVSETSTVPQGDGGRARPIVVEDNDRPAPRSNWQAQWQDPNIRPYPQHAQSADYPPPPRTLSQAYPDHPAPAPIAQRPPPPPAPYPHPVNNPTTITTAQLALQQHQTPVTHAPPPPPPVSYGPRPAHQEKSEKEKMLAGEYFKWRSSELLEEKEQCRVHLWRFNNAAQNPALGVSREERTRLFRTILEAPHVPRLPGKDIRVGSVGKDVMIEAPFMCDFGYNINIGDGVVIGSNCTIMDPCKIMIGPRTVIGPNCNIYGLDMPRDPLVRAGGLDAIAFGKDIVIEEDVFIGGNVTILPGVRIGRGSTIGAGSIVTKDISPHTVWACKQHGRLDQLQVLWGANR